MFTEGIVAEEVIVESALNVRNPTVPVRKVREVLYYLIPADFSSVTRQKRQGFAPAGGYYNPQNYGGTQSTAQAASDSHYFGPDGFAAGHGQAGAQSKWIDIINN